MKNELNYIIKKEEKEINISFKYLEKRISNENIIDANNEEVILFVSGMLPYPIEIKEGKGTTEYPDGIVERISKKTNLISVSFDWYASSELNTDYKNIVPKEYEKELIIVLNELSQKIINFSGINIITNSFGAAPTVNVINSNKFNIKSVIFRAPVINDSVSSIKFRISKKDLFYGLLLSNEDDERKKQKEYIINKYNELIENKFIFKDKTISSFVLYGENESDVRKKITIDFIQKNNSKFTEIKDAGHLIFYDETKGELLPNKNSELTENLIAEYILDKNK